MPAGLDKDDWSDSDYDLTEDDDESDSSGMVNQSFYQVLEVYIVSKSETIERFKPSRRFSSYTRAIGQIR